MIEVFAYVFAAFGLAYVLGFSKISHPIRSALWQSLLTRWFVLLIECPACLGWWTGAVAVFFHVDPFGFSRTIWHVLFGAFFTAGTNLFLALRTGLSGEQHDV